MTKDDMTLGDYLRECRGKTGKTETDTAIGLLGDGFSMCAATSLAHKIMDLEEGKTPPESYFDDELFIRYAETIGADMETIKKMAGRP
jgi:hypothetical protein